jgi:protein-tyrosine-phosphatase
MPRKKVLFVCVENACRSQIAEALVKKYYPEILTAYSAGSNPVQEINPLAQEVMKNVGIDISKNRPKGFEDVGQEKFDYVITMGCKDSCPLIPARQQITWQVEDPKGHDIAYFEKVRDKIKVNIDKLVEELR